MLGLGKRRLCTKFYVANFSYWVNIERKPTNFGELPSPWPRPLFSACDFMMVLCNPQLRAKFEVASFSSCRNIIENPKILVSSPSPRPSKLFPACVIVRWALANPSYVPKLKSLLFFCEWMSHTDLAMILLYVICPLISRLCITIMIDSIGCWATPISLPVSVM